MPYSSIMLCDYFKNSPVLQTFLTSIVLVSISSSDYKTDVMSYCKKLYFTNKVFGLTNVPKSKKKSPDKKKITSTLLESKNWLLITIINNNFKCLIAPYSSVTNSAIIFYKNWLEFNGALSTDALFFPIHIPRHISHRNIYILASERE